MIQLSSQSLGFTPSLKAVSVRCLSIVMPSSPEAFNISAITPEGPAAFHLAESFADNIQYHWWGWTLHQCSLKK
jgi:hypothetical protein